MEFFRVDLNDYWSGRLTLRKIGVYIKSLFKKPGRSTLIMAMDDHTSWSPDTYLAARISDALELANYFFLKSNSDDPDITPPVPIQRPGEPDPAKPVAPKPEDFASGQEVTAFLSRLNSM